MSNEPETLEEVKLELERRKRENPLRHAYEPHQVQEKIHRDRHDITCVLGGNRTGKSYAAVAESLMYALGRSEYAEIPEPPNTIWYVVPTSDTYRDAIKPLIEELVPPGRITSVNKRNRRYKFDNGSMLVIRTQDQRQKRMTGASVDFIAIDEPIGESMFRELQARTLDERGRILMVMTPIDEKPQRWNWIRDKLYIPWKTGEKQHIEAIHMPVADEEGEPLVPHFTKKDIRRMERQWPDPEERAIRMYGEFVTRSGLVFSSFDPDIHVIPPFSVPNHWHEWLVCDPQYHRFAVLMMAADEDGNYYVTDEYFSTDETLGYRSEQIDRMVGSRDTDVPMYVDYANPQDIQELNYHFNRINAPIGAMPLPITKKVDKMVLRVHSMLEPDEDRQYNRMIPQIGDTWGAPRLMFFNDLQSAWEENNRLVQKSRLLWELQRLTWDSKGKPDKDSAAGADCADCFDDQTEVLTREGWKFFEDVNLDDEVATVDLESDVIEYQEPIKKIEKDWDGELVSIDGQSINVRATPRHRMILHKGGRDYIRRAGDLSKWHSLKVTSHWTGEDGWNPQTIPACYKRRAGDNGGEGALISAEVVPDPETWAAFLGWYVAEGSRFSGRTRTQGQRVYRVHISQSLKEHHDEIRDILNALPWSWHQIEAGFVITSKQLYNAVGMCGDGAENKRVPQWVKDAPPRVIESFVDAAVSGDGWVNGGHRRYATVSRELAGGMQELFIKLGRAASVREREETTWEIDGDSGIQKKQYHVTEHSSNTRSLVNKWGDKSESLISREEYTGKVYCVSVPNETLIVRRNGQMLIAGNCLIYGCSVLASGGQPPEDDAWKKGLSQRDIRIHELEEQQNKRQRIGPRYSGFGGIHEL